MSFTLAIVGRPNVGKSTLFNRLVGRRLALVDDQPGVTRDLREGAGRLGPLRFTVLDSAGLEEASDESLQGRMRALTLRAVEMADVCLFLIDARAGVLASDETFAEILRRTAPRVIIGANKAEGRAGEAGMLEAYALGLGTPVALSAEHGEGMEDLLDLLLPIAEELEQKAARDAELAGLAETDIDLPDDLVEGEENEAEWAPSADRPLQMAVMGRPNSGKSTLINAIIGEERLLTGPEAGITRDAIGLSAGWAGTPIRVFDTAGMRKKSRIDDKLEKMSVSDGLRAVRFAEVVVVLLDGQIPFETQDLRIADLAEREGRAVVIGINKWDLEENKQRRLSELKEMFERLLPQLRGAPMIAFSAKTGRGLDRLHEAVLRAHQVWNRRISTARLNRWLEGMLSAHPPPAPGGRRLRIRYMTQVKARPPAFVAMCSHPDQLPESYKRYLVGGLREAFDMPGTPIRLYLRSQGDKNPYKDKKVKKVGALTKHKRPRRDG